MIMYIFPQGNGNGNKEPDEREMIKKNNEWKFRVL